jgi:hypothetical protein
MSGSQSAFDQQGTREDPEKESLSKGSNQKRFKSTDRLSRLKTRSRKTVFDECAEGVGHAKLPNFEKILGVGITFRNARVSEQILQLSLGEKPE